MKELHEALTRLGPVDWDDVPTDSLEQYVTELLTAGELITNSVPPNAEGTPFTASKPSHSQPNAAKSHKDVTASESRSHPPHEDQEKLQKSWGKPYKYKKEQNPFNVALYKMAGNDRHGAWFARRSVHEGIGFDKFKRAMMREFSEALTVQGGPGAGAIRGIAADRRLERIDVPGLGKLEVYELSAAFPGPVTPRDFVAMIFSSDKALSDKSAADVNGERHVPRHFMVLSKPVAHPDAPLRSGLVRGQYESVELIREIPLSTAKPRSSTDLLKTKSNATTVNGVHADSVETSDEPELNPVEWIMVTRSDPGGGIPRFLVERGTPDSMLGDLPKFFNWACALEDIPHPDDDIDKQKELSAQQAEKEMGEGGGLAPFEANGVIPSIDHTTEPGTSTSKLSEREVAQNSASTAATSEPTTAPGGYLSGISSAIGAGIEAYAPTAVSNAMLQHLQPQPYTSDESSDDTSSVDSFMSAEELKSVTTSPEDPNPAQSTDNFSIMSTNSEDPRSTKGVSHHEKEVHKLVQKREKLERQLAKKRMAEEQKLREAQEKEQSESGKTKEKIERELKKTEEKHRKDIEKIEAKKAKEERKAEEKRKKKDEQHKISLVTRERDDFRSQVDLYKRENGLLRNQVAELQSQVTLMMQKLEALGGPEAMKDVDEARKQKSASMNSTSSNGSEKKPEAATTL